MIKYRITKYNPDYRNQLGAYLRKEWSSYYDIGKDFNGKILLSDEYLVVEEKYCMVAWEILKHCNIEYVYIDNLEMHNVDEVNNSDKCFLDSIQNGMRISMNDLKKYMQYILREYFWCELIAKSGIKIEFGYDYYMYITCDRIEQSVIDDYQKDGIYIELYR